MSDRTREVPKLSDLTYAHTLVIESLLRGVNLLIWCECIDENIPKKLQQKVIFLLLK